MVPETGFGWVGLGGTTLAICTAVEMMDAITTHTRPWIRHTAALLLFALVMEAVVLFVGTLAVEALR